MSRFLLGGAPHKVPNGAAAPDSVNIYDKDVCDKQLALHYTWTSIDIKE